MYLITETKKRRLSTIPVDIGFPTIEVLGAISLACCFKSAVQRTCLGDIDVGQRMISEVDL